MYQFHFLGLDNEEMLLEEHDSNNSVIIDNSSDDSSYYSDDTTSVDIDDDVEDIFDDEELFLDSVYEDGKYYIGLPCLMRTQNRDWILQIAITARSLFKYDFKSVLRYLIEYSVIRIYNPTIQIMKLDISNTGSYNVIIKTFWLKIIQRTWKRVYKEQKHFIIKCINPHSLLHRQLKGKWINNKQIPSLRGMLCKN